MWKLCFCLLFYFASFTLCAGNFDSINKDLVIKNVERTVDIASQLVKISSKITLQNIGNGAVKTFLFSLEPIPKGRISNISAVIEGEDTKISLTVSDAKVQEHRQKRFWKIELQDALGAGRNTDILVEVIIIDALEPYPAEITQAEKQLVLYHGNHYFYSPYPTVSQTTSVVLSSSSVESYSKLEPVAHTGHTITYGSYDNKEPFSVSEMRIHYENNSPFMKAMNVERVIEVSHWGNIAVEEKIDLYHTGAKLKGPFSRYEYQREAKSGVSSIKSFKTELPAAATDVYYRDEIGNISTSHMRVNVDSVELDLRPRFPLFGGWKTQYVLGYSVPSYEYLYNSGNDYVLKMRFLDHVFDDMIVEHLTVKIILPEGSRDIQLSTPYPVAEGARGLHFTYLDTTGRIVVTAMASNLVEAHIQDFQLFYSFPRLFMLQEPLLLVVALFLLFLTVIIYVRLDFSISKDPVSEGRMRVAALCEKVQEHQDHRNVLYQDYLQAIAKLKASRDSSAFQNSLKTVNTELKTETQHVGELIEQIRAEAPEVVEKLKDLQKQDRQMRDYLSQQSSSAEKLVSGKINKQKYMEEDGQAVKKREECAEKITNIMSVL